MRFLTSALLGLSLLAASLASAMAQSPDREPKTAPANEWPAPLDSQASPQGRIDSLLADLKRERDQEKANLIARRLEAAWADSGSATVNLLLKWSEDAARGKREAAAFDFLDQASVLEPDFAGVWSKRASLNRTLGNDRRAMSDLNRVLVREPRHFGALSLMAMILEDSGKTEAALKTWQRYLEIYPADRAAQEKAAALSEKLAGNRA